MKPENDHQKALEVSRRAAADRDGYKVGSYQWQGLRSALICCLVNCENLVELQATWQATWRATVAHPNLRAECSKVKDDRKKALDALTGEKGN